MRRLGSLVAVLGVLLLGSCSPASGPAAGDSPAAGDQTSAPAPPPPPPPSQPAGQPTSVGTPSVVATDDPLQRADPVPIDEPAASEGITVRITGLEAIAVEAKIPGEVAGPGLAVRVELTNDTDEQIDVNSLVVNLFDATGAPGNPITSASQVELGVLAPGEQLTGAYQFAIAADQRSPVTIEVSLPGRPQLLVFTGDAPTG